MKDGKTVILYIDDDPDILSIVRIVLESEGFVMAEAPSAEEGLRAYKEKLPDLVIVDLMMEEVDAGTNFVRELQAPSATRRPSTCSARRATTWRWRWTPPNSAWPACCRSRSARIA